MSSVQDVLRAAGGEDRRTRGACGWDVGRGIVGRLAKMHSLSRHVNSFSVSASARQSLAWSCHSFFGRVIPLVCLC